MAIGTSNVVDTFRRDVMAGDFDFSSTTSQSYKIALYTNSSDLDEDTATYGDSTATAEVSATGTNYTTGGNICTVISVDVDGSVAYIQFANQSWTSATFGADGCLIYNVSTSTANRTLAVIDFGGTKTATNGTFTVTMPAAGASTSIVRLA